MHNSEVFVLSKGRPECLTARTLLEMGYPEGVTIVCGDDDETIPEYIDNFGSEMVVVFDKREWWSKCDMMDANGMTGASGISPVRNYIIELARSRGLSRCWQFDDDMVGFDVKGGEEGRRRVESGEELHRLFNLIEGFGEKCGLPVVGFSTFSTANDSAYKFTNEVCTAHNVSTDFDMLYRARIFEDAVCMWDLLRKGVIQYNFNFLQAIMNHPWYGSTMSERANTKGGMHQQYKDMTESGDGRKQKQSLVWVRNTGYATMAMPRGNVMRVKQDGSCHKGYRLKALKPKVLRETYRKFTEA